jgi:hypothetical protein
LVSIRADLSTVVRTNCRNNDSQPVRFRKFNRLWLYNRSTNFRSSDVTDSCKPTGIRTSRRIWIARVEPVNVLDETTGTTELLREKEGR